MRWSKIHWMACVALAACCGASQGSAARNTAVNVSHERGAAPSKLTTERTDPLTGRHWLQSRDPQHPGAPPRLGLTQAHVVGGLDAGEGRATICVHAGDSVSLEAGNAHSQVRMTGIALESGINGDRIRVRIAATGAIGQMTIRASRFGTLNGLAGGWR